MDKTQRRIMLVLPLLFIGITAQFPAGLVLYWMTTNLWTVGQGLITRRLVPKTPVVATGPKRSSRTPPKAEPDAEEAPKQPPKPPQPPRRVKRKKGGARR
jgi:YidC/Oxa1 family membrane protein insertase